MAREMGTWATGSFRRDAVRTDLLSLMRTSEHVPVLWRESIEALRIKVDGRYVDATFGRGGHTKGILRELGPEGRVLAIDKDRAAVDFARENLEADKRFAIWHGSFANLTWALSDHEMGPVDGVLMDLGVSSPQIDQAERGFSFSGDGPLDMRMNTTEGPTARQWLEATPEDEIVRVLREYGEERFAGRIARAIKEEIREGGLKTTAQLADLIASAAPRTEHHKHPATRSFQAIRIAVNNELDELKQGLQAAFEALRPGGRLAVISFHSVEDRLVKRFMQSHARPAPGDRRRPQLPSEAPDMRIIGKPVKPSSAECELNPRARSAVLRTAEKL